MTRLANGEDCRPANTASKVNGTDSHEQPSKNKSKCHGRLGAMAGLKGWQLVQTGIDDESDNVWQLAELACAGAQQQTPAQPIPQESACCEIKVAVSGAMSGAAKISTSEIGKNLFRRNVINRRVGNALGF
jgi:hypothetical protein